MLLINSLTQWQVDFLKTRIKQAKKEKAVVWN
jgi:hypothetical protein